MTRISGRIRFWAMLARPPLFAVAVGACAGVAAGSAAVGGVVAGALVLLTVGWRRYWRPNSPFVGGDL